MANDFYQHSGHPGTRAPRSSALLRAEFAAIEDGFDKLPDVSTANLFAVSDGSALVGKTVAQAKVLLALENVTNTADADKPISTLAQAALDLKADAATTTSALNLKADAATTTSALNLKAPLASPALTGNPTAPTQLTSDTSTKLATTMFVDQRIRALIYGGKGTHKYFPDGTLMQWGVALTHATPGTKVVVNFHVAFVPVCVLATGISLDNVYANNYTGTSFDIYGSAPSLYCVWLAIGYYY